MPRASKPPEAHQQKPVPVGHPASHRSHRTASSPAYYAGMTTTEIAEQLDTNRSTIKTRIPDGLRKLITDLKNYTAALALRARAS